MVLARTAYQDAFFAWPHSERERYVALLRVADPLWAPGFLHWLRSRTPMRYAALAGAAAFVAGRLERGEHGLSRQVIASVLCRADDPGHLLAYWAAAHGPTLPKPVKRGVADAVTRLYDEQALLAYDDGGHHFEIGFVRADLPRLGGIGTPGPLRFGEVIRLVHPRARDDAQADLFRHALARRHGRVRTIPATLPLVRSWAGMPAPEDGVSAGEAGEWGGAEASLPPAAGRDQRGGAAAEPKSPDSVKAQQEESAAEAASEDEVPAGPLRQGSVAAGPGGPVAEETVEHEAPAGRDRRGGAAARPGVPASEAEVRAEPLRRQGVSEPVAKVATEDEAPAGSMRWGSVGQGTPEAPTGSLPPGSVVAPQGRPIADDQAAAEPQRGVDGASPMRPAAADPTHAGGASGQPAADHQAPSGPMHLLARLRSGPDHPPPGQWLAQLRRTRTPAHAATLLAALPVADLLARPGGLARLEPLIPYLPLATLLAHLRRFDAAGMGFETAMAVAARIGDPGEVRASGLGPLRFAAAWGAVDSRRWEPALAAGARHSLGAVPQLPGRTLVVIEPWCDTRIVFGLALAQRCDEADVVLLGGGRFPLEPGESPLHALIRWHSTDLRTATPVAAGHDRVVLVTEHCFAEPDVPAGVPRYVWETRRLSRHEYEPERGFFRGLGDASFRIIPWWEEFVAGDRIGC